jgi:TRAP-type uncharacterized transport system substrate-binding protein
MAPLEPPRLPQRTRWRDALPDAGPWLMAAALVLLALVLALAIRWLDPTPARRVVLATGPEQGAYGEFAKRYPPLLAANDVTLTLRATQGSADNLALLRDPASGVQAAFVQGGVDAAAGSGGAGLVTLGSVAYEPLWIFYREASASARLRGAAPERLAQLAGWRLNVGPEGGGTAPLFALLAEANGLAGESAAWQRKPAVHGVVDLVQGQIDALAMVSAADAPLVQYLLRTPGVQPMAFAQAEAYSRRFPFLRALALPRGIVDLAADQPARDVPLVAATASLVARADLHPALVQLLVQAARQVHGGAGWFHDAGTFPSAARAEWPVAAEAERYLRAGPPWLQRYLPFWLANFVDRMWIVLLPLLAALLPLSRVLPPLVELRLRSRVFRWYAHLRAIENALDAPAPDVAGLQQRLEHIDAQTDRIGVPLSYAHELYDLRNHIEMVRRRLAAYAAGTMTG